MAYSITFYSSIYGLAFTLRVTFVNDSRDINDLFCVFVLSFLKQYQLGATKQFVTKVVRCTCMHFTKAEFFLKIGTLKHMFMFTNFPSILKATIR